jgi:carbonic anhydrase
MTTRSRWALPVVTLVVAMVLISSDAHAQWKTPWSYEGERGADHWSALDPAYAACNAGKEQSPIDIRNAQTAALPTVRFEYQKAPLKYLLNNGYTIRVNYHDDAGAANLLLVGDQRYHLTQFHFHRPSEEYVDGKTYDMVLHLMHEGLKGEIIGVAVLLKQGAANATVQQIWDHMPTRKTTEQAIPGVKIDPARMLPPETDYYTYMGSLTAPPCTEGVRWFILRAAIEVSRQQIEAFAKLYPHDVRPVQQLNGRVVQKNW